MKAEIIGLPQADLRTLKVRVDGARGKLGCEKVHVRVNYDQVIAFPSLKLFNALEEEF